MKLSQHKWKVPKLSNEKHLVQRQTTHSGEGKEESTGQSPAVFGKQEQGKVSIACLPKSLLSGTSAIAPGHTKGNDKTLTEFIRPVVSSKVSASFF